MGNEPNNHLNKLVNDAQIQTEAISRITFDESILHGDVEKCCQLITEALVRVLGITLSSIWIFSKCQNNLVCLDRYSTETQSHDSEGVLEAEQFPNYIKILKKEHHIYSDDVRDDERLQELNQIYFQPEGILSTLEVGIKVGGELLGVICNEQKHVQRDWFPNEKSFCKTMASLLSLCMTNAEQKKILDDLKHQKKLLEITEKVAKIGSWEWTVETNQATWSDELFHIFQHEISEKGLSTEEFFQTIHPDDLDNYKNTLSITIAENIPFKVLIKCKREDGQYIDISINGFPKTDNNGKVIQIAGCLQDVTEELRLERERKENAELSKSILSALSEGIIVQRKENKIDICNESACKILRLTEDQVLMKTSFDPRWKTMKEDGSAFPPDEHPIIRTIRTGEAFDDVIMTIQVGDSERSIISINSRAVFNDQKEQVGAVATFHDVTERKKTEQQLVASEARNRAIISALPDLLFLLDENFVITQCHTPDESLLISPKSEIMGKPLKDFLPPALYELKLEKEKECREINGPAYYQYELELSHGTHIFDARMVPCSETEVLIVARDITERVRAQEAMQKIDRLESIGTLAGGIAHDFNNILLGFFLNLSIAKDELVKSHPAYPYLLDAENCLTRARGLTQQLLTFSKGGEPIRQNVGIRELVEEVSRFDLSGSNVIARIKSSENLWEADGDQAQLQQVFSNLIVNANQAMPEGGHIDITIENHDVETPVPVNLRKGNYLKVTLKDHGNGISTKYLKKIFDPFFTTKQKGNGLGLATVYSIVHKHGGHIDVESELEQGTTFSLFLPASMQNTTEESSFEKKETPNPLRNRRVLLLDDQEAILAVLTKMLTRFGAKVDKTKDGKETVESYRKAFESGEPYDITIMDLTIPAGMGGQEAVKHILEINPDAKCIVSSGYAEDLVLSNYVEYGFKGMVVKPYTKSTLFSLLNKVLEDTE